MHWLTFSLIQAIGLVDLSKFSPTGIVVFVVSYILIILSVLHLLSILLHREWVKKDLRKRDLKPIRVTYQPFYRVSPLEWDWSGNPRFTVIYRDGFGRLHQAICKAYLNRNVYWISDDFISD